MKKCPMCGSTEIVRDGELYKCKECGTQFSYESGGGFGEITKSDEKPKDMTITREEAIEELLGMYAVFTGNDASLIHYANKRNKVIDMAIDALKKQMAE